MYKALLININPRGGGGGGGGLLDQYLGIGEPEGLKP